MVVSTEWSELEKIKQKNNDTKQNSKQNPLKLDLRVFEKSVTSFRIELKNRFDALKDKEPTIEKMNRILAESMDTIQNEIQRYTIKY